MAKTTMKLTVLLALISMPVMASEDFDGTRYDMRVDGVACPYCAYGIEKKLRKIDGVKSVDIDLEQGVVSVCTSDTVAFSDERLTELFNDAGFTYRGKKLDKC